MALIRHKGAVYSSSPKTAESALSKQEWDEFDKLIKSLEKWVGSHQNAMAKGTQRKLFTTVDTLMDIKDRLRPVEG